MHGLHVTFMHFDIHRLRYCDTQFLANGTLGIRQKLLSEFRVQRRFLNNLLQHVIAAAHDALLPSNVPIHVRQGTADSIHKDAEKCNLFWADELRCKRRWHGGFASRFAFLPAFASAKLRRVSRNGGAVSIACQEVDVLERSPLGRFIPQRGRLSLFQSPTPAEAPEIDSRYNASCPSRDLSGC